MQLFEGRSLSLLLGNWQMDTFLGDVLNCSFSRVSEWQHLLGILLQREGGRRTLIKGLWQRRMVIRAITSDLGRLRVILDLDSGIITLLIFRIGVIISISGPPRSFQWDQIQTPLPC